MVTLIHQTASELGFDELKVLGPIGAVVFMLFVMEIIVPGKAYKRLETENTQLREMNAKIIPVAEEMVGLSKKMIDVTESATSVMEDFVDWWTTESSQRRVRR